jgi:hypothetical protein
MRCRFKRAHHPIGGGSGGQCQVIPMEMSVAVEVGRFEGGDGEVPGFGPVHAGALETSSDQLLAGRFGHAGVDLPAGGAKRGIVHPFEPRPNVFRQGFDPRPTNSPQRPALIDQPSLRRFAASGVEWFEPLVRPLAARRFLAGD